MARPLTSLLLAGAMGASAWAAEPARIAVVIDDLGYIEHQNQAVLALDTRVAVAIIPDGPLAPTLSAHAARQGRDALIHLPLAGLERDDCSPEAICPQPHWSARQMANHLRWSLQRVENAVGINNHQGSRFTADPAAVDQLLRGLFLIERLDRTELFVLDSRTTADSVLESRAARAGLGSLRRHVFLDNDRHPDAIESAWHELLKLARRDGQAVAIGHPHPETIDFLADAIPRLEESGVELVTIRELVARPAPSASTDREAPDSPR